MRRSFFFALKIRMVAKHKQTAQKSCCQHVTSSRFTSVIYVQKSFAIWNVSQVSMERSFA